MEEKQEFLNEAKYKKAEKKIVLLAIIIFIIGWGVGIFLITKGIIQKNGINNTYSEENKQKEIKELNSQIATAKAELNTKISELTSKGVVYDTFASYNDGEKYDLKIMQNALDPGFDHCSFDEYKNNALTTNYCTLKNKLEKVKSEDVNFERSFNSHGYFIYFAIGGFIMFATLGIAISIFMFAKRRSIVAFGAQQIMPVAQEGMEKMAPTIGKAGAEIIKGMAPAYGEVAKEISKGIKESLNNKDEDKDKDDK